MVYNYDIFTWMHYFLIHNSRKKKEHRADRRCARAYLCCTFNPGSSCNAGNYRVVKAKATILCCMEVVLVVIICETNRVTFSITMIKAYNTILELRWGEFVALIIYRRLLNSQSLIKMIILKEVLHRSASKKDWAPGHIPRQESSMC